MNEPVRPAQALYSGEKPFPVIPSCEHFAGSEKRILKALELQRRLGPIFDITCDCEDGAAAGREREHAEMVARVLNSPANSLQRAGIRVHDYTHRVWRQDIDILVPACGARLSHITLPKPTRCADAARMIEYVQSVCANHGIAREIPIHVLVETHGALREAHEIAALPWMQVLDFGLMDFVSAHHGAIAASAMRAPGQFEHALLRRAKTEIVAAALANGIVPAHNVCLDLKNPQTAFADARRARDEFGFQRMWSIHPIQIQPIVDAMRPDLSEVDDAVTILLAAQENDWGPVQYKGELHDRATYRYFWELAQKARVTGIPLTAHAQHALFD
jgi:citrate lyase subunit beta / citryl-CoA lyase